MPKCKRCLKEINWVKVNGEWKPWDVEKDTWHVPICGKKEPKKKKLSEIEKLRQMRADFELRNSEDCLSK